MVMVLTRRKHTDTETDTKKGQKRLQLGTKETYQSEKSWQSPTARSLSIDFLIDTVSLRDANQKGRIRGIKEHGMV